MDIRGLVLVNSASVDLAEHNQFSNFAPGLTDVAGKSPLERTAERLQKFGVSPITAVIEGPSYTGGIKPLGNITQIAAPPDRFWRAAEGAFNDLVQAGAELVVLVRLGAYAEIDFENMVQFHLDLRQFAIDILTLKTETAPAGEQIRPGVWAAPHAQIEKGARVLAPAFIGSYARVRSGAVITRCSSIEHHAQVDCGTVIENASLLSYSYIGAALELAHSLAGFSCIWNLRRDCVVRISDSKLLRHSAASSGNRLLSSTAELVTYLPKQFWRGIFRPSPAPSPDLNNALRQTSPSLGAASGYRAPACDSQAANEFPTNLVVARTHGNQ
jgi:hypothetical protein